MEDSVPEGRVAAVAVFVSKCGGRTGSGMDMDVGGRWGNTQEMCTEGTAVGPFVTAMKAY